jgi:hypothetical protein
MMTTTSSIFICGISYYNRGMAATNKGKEIPLQAWAGPEGSRRLRLPDFKTVGT